MEGRIIMSDIRMSVRQLAVSLMPNVEWLSGTYSHS